MTTHPKESVLIIKHGALGDIILASGHIHAIRQHHPEAHITCLTGRAYTSLMSLCPYIDEVWEDAKPRITNISGCRALIARLRSRRFDVVYDLQTSTRSNAYWWLMPTPKPRWSGIGRWVSHPQCSPERHSMHTTARLNDQLRIAGIATDGTPAIDWLNAPTAQFALPSPYALLVAGGSAHRPEKRWPVARYIELAKKLVEHGIIPVLIGSGAEQTELQSISDAIPQALNFCGKTTIPEIASLARGAVWALGNDTGPMHIIAASGCPSTVLFSAVSSPTKSAPQGGSVTCLQKDPLASLPAEEVWQSAPSVIHEGA
jgi:ADP-heptose:LPS heptosyltransferase